MKQSHVTDGWFADQVRFLNRLISSPRDVGAIAPSGSALGRAMAAQVDPDIAGPVVELGPGSGAITKALLEVIPASRLTVIERDPAFAALIAGRYRDVTVLCDDAFELDRIAAAHFKAPCAAVVSGMPLLNFPEDKRHGLLDAVLGLLTPGAPFIQFTYGLKMPVPPPARASATHAAFIWKNMPPAHVWVYRKV